MMKKQLKSLITLTITLGIFFSCDLIIKNAYAQNTTNTNTNVKTKSTSMKIATISGATFYLIESEEDLRSIGTGIYSLSANYMLNSDITLTKEWTALGNPTTPFTGTFDGNGFKINNLKITDKNAEYVGLFGFAENATIHNVILNNVDILNAGKSKKHVGAIVALSFNSKVYDNKVI